jgi:hypothetical protein
VASRAVTVLYLSLKEHHPKHAWMSKRFSGRLSQIESLRLHQDIEQGFKEGDIRQMTSLCATCRP